MNNVSITLTPNRRLARYLSQIAAVPINQWLEECYQQSQNSHVLLNKHQERFLWQKIIVAILGTEFISITSTIIKAYELLIKWQVIYQELDYDYPDFIIFNKIVRKFEDYCAENNLVTTCKLPSLLTAYIKQTKPKINLLGFDECWPQLQTLLTGLEVTKQDPNNYCNAICKIISCANTSNEITLAARWAKQININNPKATIGIVVNDLTDLRTQIIRIFTRVLGDNKNFNISAGEILGSISIIKYILDLLSLHEPICFDTISKLLLSNYLKTTTDEQRDRILLAWQLQQSVDTKAKLYIKDLEYFANKHQRNIPEFIAILAKIQALIKNTNNIRLLNADWIEVFIQILQVVGINCHAAEVPRADCPLTEYELQVIERFSEALQETAHVDLITGKVYYKQSLRNLRNLLDNTVFQTSTKTNPKIHILGALEAAGINFDYMWIMGVDQKNWPKAVSPNPFIPIRLQKQFNLPKSSAERELEFCTRLINRFKRSAANIIFSYVNQEEDRIIAPSSLIADIALINIEDLALAEFTDPAKQIYMHRVITCSALSPCDDRVALMPHESIHGGNRLIEMQSLCPFRAFTEFRLKVKEVKKVEPGISKITRGILIHTILDQFWQQIKTKQNLCTQTASNLQNIIQDKIQYALDKEKIPKYLSNIEQKCLTRLIHRWLEIEKNRDDFTVIATEKTFETTIGELTIQLRVDRIDRLADDSLMVIDYKSGKILPATTDWFGERPVSTQLPIYCIAIDQLQGLALAQVNTQILKLKAIDLKELASSIPTVHSISLSDADNVSSRGAACGIQENLKIYWRSILEKLAQDFVCGKAEVNPLNEQVCQTCSFISICHKQNI